MSLCALACVTKSLPWKNKAQNLASNCLDSSSKKTVLDVILGLASDRGASFDNNPDNFDILAHFLILANITTPLSDENTKLTVFAPSDAAFLRTVNDFGMYNASEESVFALFKTLLKAIYSVDDVALAVKDVLLYHVAPQRLSSKDVLAATSIDTLGNAPPLARNRKHPLVLVDETTFVRNPELVISALDIPASNGVVHVINRVLLPLKPFDSNPDNFDILNHIRSISKRNYSHFVTNYTFFRPSDSAFIRTANDFGANVQSEADAFVAIKKLFLAIGAGRDISSVAKEVLLYHIAPARLTYSNILSASSIETLASAPPLTRDPASPLALVDQALKVTNPQLVEKYPDRTLTFDIYIIDRVLLPVNIDPKNVPSLGKPSPEPSVGANDSACFPASAVVRNSGGVQVSMEKLAAGVSIR
jgi:uncharacterized surface protein with fasciclin (FAS1) repeats